jgi:hypothetical protein
MLFAGIGGAGAAKSASGGPHQPAEDFTCQSPQCPISISDNASAVEYQAATPYPSEISIGRVDCCVIDKVTVTLTGLTHAALEDVDVLLVRELGSQVDIVELMSDVGAKLTPAANVTLTFDDAASASLPRGVPVTSGTYKPTNYPGSLAPCVADNPPSAANADPFPAPAPAPPAGGYFETLNVFHGRIDSGMWSLYVGDDCVGGIGSIMSWSLSLTFLSCFPLCLIKRADSVRVAAGSAIGFTVHADNDFHQYPPEQYFATASVNDPLPSGPGIDWSINPPFSGPGNCWISGAVGTETLACDFGFFPGEYADVHVTSATSTQSCKTYTNTATLSGFSQTWGSQFRQDTDSIAVVACPTAVRLSSFAAIPSPNGVLLRWRTAAEGGTLGFNVYRRRDGRFVKLNRTVIPSAFAASSGHAYSWLDRAAPKGAAAYRLQAVGLDGTRRWLGAAVVAR